MFSIKYIEFKLDFGKFMLRSSNKEISYTEITLKLVKSKMLKFDEGCFKRGYIFNGIVFLVSTFYKVIYIFKTTLKFVKL